MRDQQATVFADVDRHRQLPETFAVVATSEDEPGPLLPRWVPIVALGVVAAVAVLGLSRPADRPEAGAPSVAVADPTRSHVSARVDVVQLPGNVVVTEVLEAATATVNGDPYLVSIGRSFDWPNGLEASGTTSYEGEKRTVYRIPGVPARTALLMETNEGEGDHLGAYPKYLVLKGSDDFYDALCQFVKPGKTLTQCEDLSP